jgi:hypothetical protein
VHLHFHGVSAEDVAAIIARRDEAGEWHACAEAADRIELSTSAIARLLASDMREELLTIMGEICGEDPGRPGVKRSGYLMRPARIPKGECPFRKRTPARARHEPAATSRRMKVIGLLQYVGITTPGAWR